MHRYLYAEATLSAVNGTYEVGLRVLMGGGWQRIFTEEKKFRISHLGTRVNSSQNQLAEPLIVCDQTQHPKSESRLSTLHAFGRSIVMDPVKLIPDTEH